ncbi:MAG: ImmA/IrrE family metallo-endopeptidase [Massilia sp.]
MNNSSFRPEWATPPGATVRALMESRHISQVDLSGILATSSEEAENLLIGASSISEEIAQRLAAHIGGSAAFWLTRETQYREALVRVEAAKTWLSAFPFTEMSKLGWVHQTPDDTSRVHACLSFFGVPTTEEWFRKYSSAAELAAFRKTARYESSEGATLAWLRQGEIEAQKIPCAAWNRKLLGESLETLRGLTRLSEPVEFLKALRDTLAACGVRAVVVRPPQGCKAHGATYFVDGKPIVLLSFRYLADDQFWFTVFHEVGHLLLHSDGKTFVEGHENPDGKEEIEANEFASATLVPKHWLDALRRIGADGRAVMRIAKELNVAPGIVVGQMQFQGVITFRQLNNLKRRFKWAE